MKKISATLLSLFIVAVVTAQKSIKLEDLSNHIGDSITVCGKVAGIRYFENSKNKPTFLNIGANHPNQLLTVVIWEATRALFTTKVEELMDKEICITGRVILYKEKPEIVIEKPDQVVVQ